MEDLKDRYYTCIAQLAKGAGKPEEAMERRYR